jgi:hypothetical protein
VPAKQKRVVSRFLGLSLNDYYLQEGIQAIENPQVTLSTPAFSRNQGKKLVQLGISNKL